MPIVKIKVQEKLLTELLNYIGQFRTEEMQLINEASNSSLQNISESETKYLKEALQRLESGKGKSYTTTELSELLDQTIQKSEH